MKCQVEIEEILALAKQLLAWAEQHGAECEQDECLLLDGEIRDCAYKIQAAAERWRKLRKSEDGRECPLDKVPVDRACRT